LSTATGNRTRDHNTADGLDYIGVWNASMLHPTEMAEAITARGEKRDANFVELPPIKRTISRD
jgi:enoyl-CoA hydratase